MHYSYLLEELSPWTAGNMRFLTTKFHKCGPFSSDPVPLSRAILTVDGGSIESSRLFEPLLLWDAIRLSRNARVAQERRVKGNVYNLQSYIFGAPHNNGGAHIYAPWFTKSCGHMEFRAPGSCSV